MGKMGTVSEMLKYAVLSAVIAFALPEYASATVNADVNTILRSVGSTQLISLPYILSVVCYIGGAFMLVSGALSLKKHAENPTQEPMGKGVARLVTGAAITSVPALSGVITRTVGVTGATANYSGFGQNFTP